MGNITSDLLIWTPDENDLAEPDVYLATMAQSIEDGVGDRLRKQESFVGVNLSLDSAQTISGGTAGIVPFKVYSTWNYNEGMTVNASGSVTVVTAGMYQVNLNANFLPANTTPARINTYIYKDGAPIAFSSTYGEANTARYSNSNIIGVYKFDVGDVIAVYASNGDSNTVMQAGAGSGFSMALIARA